jgi:hypothetical protein
MMRRRTSADNRQLSRGEVQIEDIRGAVSVVKSTNTGATAVRICTVRGWSSRKAQAAWLSREGVDALIEELQRVRDEVFGGQG